MNGRFVMKLLWRTDRETMTRYVECSTQAVIGTEMSDIRTFGIPEASCGPNRDLKAENDAVAKCVRLMADYGVSFTHLEIVRV